MSNGDGGGGPRVLVVDDERSLARLVASYLEREGYRVECAFDGTAALASAREHDPEVIVLDLMLPGVDGLEVCRQVRTFSDCYIVMLTARADEVDKLVGLGVGADDYLTKPFSPRELVARVKAMLRRPRSQISGGDQSASRGRPAPGPGLSDGDVLRQGGALRRCGALSIDVEAREVTVDGVMVELTRTEFDLLCVLSGRPRMAFSRAQLVAAVWGETWVGDEHLVDVHLGHVRRKLGDDTATQRYVRTVRGVGYRMGDGR